ncbi:MAG: hypothetical protein WA688_09190 [Thermoplasmata archaeon]
MMRQSPSVLYRLAQILRVLAILALVFIVLFLATVAFSAVELGEGVAKQSGSLHHSLTATIVGTDILVNVTFPIPNQGYYNVRDLTLVAIFSNETIQSNPLAVTTGGPSDIPGHGQGDVSLLTSFDMANPAGPFLLLNDAEIQGTLFLNASYAVIIPVNLEVAFDYHWGAPFANLSYTIGTPTPESNQTVAIPVTIFFENHTPGLTIVGNLAVVVSDPNGTLCTRQTFPVDDQQGPDTLTETFYAPDTCSLVGDTVTSVFTSPGPPPFSIPLPTETIP